MKNIRIAIQNKGRLAQASTQFLKSLGFKFNPNGRNCVASCLNYDADILFLRDDDIPEYVERGIADFGIVGENILLEKRVRVTTLKKLDFGKCRLVIAVPQEITFKNITDLDKKRIATSYPDILKQFLQIQQIKTEIIPIKGSAEIAPSLNLADAVCDLVQTGQTLKENNLKPVITIFKSQAVLIKTPYINKKNIRKYEYLFTANT